MGGFAEVENDELTILVNGAEEGASIDKEEAQKELEEMTIRFNEAKVAKKESKLLKTYVKLEHVYRLTA